jgi:hypothetical protein
MSSLLSKLAWCIYYSDGTTFSSADGEPWQAPARKVIIINQRHEDPDERPYVQHRENYYIWLGYRWLGCDRDRLTEYWFLDNMVHDFRRASLMGYTAPNAVYDAIVRAAKQDEEFYDTTNL